MKFLEVLTRYFDSFSGGTLRVGLEGTGLTGWLLGNEHEAR